MEKYYQQVWAGNSYYFYIINENGDIVKKVRDDKDVEGLTEVYSKSHPLTATYRNNVGVSDRYVILGERIEGAAVAAAKTFNH